MGGQGWEVRVRSLGLGARRSGAYLDTGAKHGGQHVLVEQVPRAHLARVGVTVRVRVGVTVRVRVGGEG